VYATDEGDIELHGVRQAGTYSHPEIMNQSLAQAIAQLILQKQLYNRNQYTVKLGQEFILLEPMDAVTLESQLANLGVTSVRVVEIVESAEDYSLEITFEDNLSGVLTAPDYATQSADRATSYTNANPGNINPPIMFEAPEPLVTSATGCEVWIYASGSNKWWGGCNIYISSDGNSYQYLGRINQPARQGVLTAYLPSHSTPDNVNTLAVDMSMSSATLVSVSQQDADDYVSLCWIEGDENGEFISYQNATLTGVSRYNLTHLNRGAYDSDISDHSAGANFVRCDDDVAFKMPFSEKDIDQTYYVKFVSFNVFGSVEQDISSVSPYIITLHGYNRKGVIESGAVTLTNNEATTIFYKHKFWNVPYPQVTIVDEQEGDVLHVDNQTTTSFSVWVENQGGSQGPTVVVMGNSLSSGYPYTSHMPSPSEDVYSWTHYFRELSGYEVINSAIAGDNSAQMLDRFGSDVISYSPDYCIIETGGNDYPNFGASYLSQTLSNIDSMLSMCNDNGIKVIFLTPTIAYNMPTDSGGFPHDASERTEWQNYLNSVINHIRGLGYTPIMFYQPIWSSYNVINYDYMYDAGHPNEEGYEKIGTDLTPRFTSIIGSGSTGGNTRTVNYLVYGT
jgi:lysophospholipase L1-like esterase